MSSSHSTFQLLYAISTGTSGSTFIHIMEASSIARCRCCVSMVSRILKNGNGTVEQIVTNNSRSPPRPLLKKLTLSPSRRHLQTQSWRLTRSHRLWIYPQNHLSTPNAPEYRRIPNLLGTPFHTFQKQRPRLRIRDPTQVHHLR